MNQDKSDSSPSQKTEFEELGEQQQLTLAQEFLLFIWENKAWWMVPILVVLTLLGIIVALTSTGAAPFIYTMF